MPSPVPSLPFCLERVACHDALEIEIVKMMMDDDDDEDDDEI